MEDNTPNQNMPLLCRKGCGFFGSPNFDGLCSKCHRDAEQQKPQDLKQAENQSRTSEKDLSPLGEKEKKVVDDCVKSAVDTLVASSVSVQPLPESNINDKLSETASDAPSPSSLVDKDAATPTSITDNADTESSHSSSTNSTPKPKKNRCFTCKKKVGLTGFDCRCGGVYCSTHRYSDMHSCAFDYRESGQEEIRRANPHIISSKIQKI